MNRPRGYIRTCIHGHDITESNVYRTPKGVTCCRVCIRANNRKVKIWIRRHGNKEQKIRAGVSRSSEQTRARNRRIKEEVLRHYGGRCHCCKESTLMFLTIDHINNDGNKHRKEINRTGHGFLKWLRTNDYPGGYRVLCFNCNCGRSANGGICPHKERTK